MVIRSIRKAWYKKGTVAAVQIKGATRIAWRYERTVNMGSTPDVTPFCRYLRVYGALYCTDAAVLDALIDLVPYDYGSDVSLIVEYERDKEIRTRTFGQVHFASGFGIGVGTLTEVDAGQDGVQTVGYLVGMPRNGLLRDYVSEVAGPYVP